MGNRFDYHEPPEGAEYQNTISNFNDLYNLFHDFYDLYNLNHDSNHDFLNNSNTINYIMKKKNKFSSQFWIDISKNNKLNDNFIFIL